MVPAFAVKKIRFRQRALRGRFCSSKRMRDVGQANNWQNFQSNPYHDRGEIVDKITVWCRCGRVPYTKRFSACERISGATGYDD